MRYQIDFLDFCQDDIQWFLIVFSLIVLSIFSVAKEKEHDSILPQFLLSSVQMALDVLIVYVIYFSKINLKQLWSPLNLAKTYCWITVTCLAQLCMTAVLFYYWNAERRNPLFNVKWQTYLFLHACIHAQLLLVFLSELLNWPKYEIMWKKQLLLRTMFTRQITRADGIDGQAVGTEGEGDGVSFKKLKKRG